MVKFKNFYYKSKIKKTSFIINEYTLTIYYNENDSQYINEGKQRGKSLGKAYSALQHQPRTSPGTYHLHVYYRSKQIFAINKDGTAHDRSHGYQIPNIVANGIRSIFPDYTLPNNNFIESANLSEELLTMYSL